MSAQETLTALKPCPFCGGEPERNGLYVVCRECSCQVNIAQDWNRRATHPSRDGGARKWLRLGKHMIAERPYGEVYLLESEVLAALNSLPSQHQPAQSGGGTPVQSPRCAAGEGNP